MDAEISRLARESLPLALEILSEAIRIPADHVDRDRQQGGDPQCGLSNHEGPRLEYLKGKILEVGAVDDPQDVGYDDFGNLVWTVQDDHDGVPSEERSVIFFDGHTDTVQPLRDRWLEAFDGGVDPYLGAIDVARIDPEVLGRELGYVPPHDQWHHLLWGRGSADQLGGVVCQILATRILRQLRDRGALHGVIVRSYATVAEEDNDGGGPMYVMRHELPGKGAERIPDVVILTEGTGCAERGAVGIYRGQRGRMQIEVDVLGKSCHGSMPWEGRNPLEYGSAIIAEAADRYRRGEGFAEDAFLGAGTRTASFATLETPSDCAVPERFVFRFDRRLTAGEDPEQARHDVETMESVARARGAGLEVEVRIPTYRNPTWRGYEPGNPQIYPGWLTPEEHPAIRAAAEAYRLVASPLVDTEERDGARRREPRVSRWVFSTDGVGFPVPREGSGIEVPPSKNWISSGIFEHPAMFGIGPGIEQNTHKVGECVDTREIPLAIAVLARFPSLYRSHRS